MDGLDPEELRMEGELEGQHAAGLVGVAELDLLAQEDLAG